MTTRTHFAFRIDLWTNDGESIVEHVAGAEDFQLALATYRAAVERWPGLPITLRQGSRVIEDSRRTRTASWSNKGSRESGRVCRTLRHSLAGTGSIALSPSSSDAARLGKQVVGRGGINFYLTDIARLFS
jgi:hypothetical protein